MNLLLNIRAKYCFLRAKGIYYNCQQKGVDRMAGNTTNISIRMDADLKAQADALFTELGMNLTTAFNIFVRQSLREGGIPFEVRLEQPNKETVAAMLPIPCKRPRAVFSPTPATPGILSALSPISAK